MKLTLCAIIALLQLGALCAPPSDYSSLKETDGTISNKKQLLQDSQSSQSRIRRAPDDVITGKLKWQRWEGVLPSGAVSIKNDYTNRIDYVCHFDCEAGFYTPSKGPYCYFPYADQELQTDLFKILVNEDNYEIFEWKDGSYGSVPENAVPACKGVSSYVGKNRYGLGKVVPRFKAFFLPWEGYEYWYKYYQVLTVKKI